MIKNNLKKLMKEKNVTIADLHRTLGISRPTLTKMANNETDGIRYDTINKLCKFFKISPNELLVFVPFDKFECTVNPTKSIKLDLIRVEKEDVRQLTDLGKELDMALSFDENTFSYISSEVKYFPKKLLYVAFELQNEDKAKEKEFFKFVRRIDSRLNEQVKRKTVDCIREALMLDYSVNVVIVADFMRILEHKDIYESKE